ncbi:MAG: hypothetical protein JEZ09_17775 [Salinivirgaceae bacterium]|nr:hypothetical protein [Salinivirgaceae bacterium]
MMEELSIEKEVVQIIFRNVKLGVGRHGSLLTFFAETILHADVQNFVILYPAALQLIEKYDLNRPPYTEDRWLYNWNES